MPQIFINAAATAFIPLEEEEEDIFSHQLTGTVHSNDNDFSVTGLYMIVQCLIDERAAKSAEALYK